MRAFVILRTLVLQVSTAAATLHGAVDTYLGSWTDPVRERTVPYRVYHPVDLAAPAPVVIFSHGLGGSRDGAEYLGQAWAGAGYVAVFLQHPGSDDAVWRGEGLRPAQMMEALRRAAADPANAVHRPLDVTFAIDQLDVVNREPGPLRGHLDLERIAVAGHSFGAYTALAVAGLRLGPGAGRMTLADPRVACAIVLSAPQPRPGQDLEAHYGGIRTPLFVMTGTADTSPLDAGRAPEDRQLVFEHAREAERVLVVFQDGDHMVFSGRRRGAALPSDAPMQAMIVKGSLAFLAQHLRGDVASAAYLRDGGYAGDLGALAARYAYALPGEQARP